MQTRYVYKFFPQKDNRQNVDRTHVHAMHTHVGSSSRWHNSLDLKLPHFTLLIQACTNYTKIHMHSDFEDGDLSKAIGIFNILSLVEHW